MCSLQSLGHSNSDSGFTAEAPYCLWGQETKCEQLKGHEVWKTSKDASRANQWFLLLVCCWPSSVHIVPLSHTTYCSRQNQQQHVDFPNSLSWDVALTIAASQSVCFITETMSALTVWIWIVINISLTFWHHVTIIHDYQGKYVISIQMYFVHALKSQFDI